MKNKILLLGAGGNVTNGIYRIVRGLKKFNYNIFVSCVHTIPVYCGDKFIQSPFAKDLNFFSWLDEVIRDNEIDLVITGVEEIILEIALNKEFIEQHPKTEFLIEDISNLDVFQSKLKTCQWLEGLGLDFPIYYSPLVHNSKRRDVLQNSKKLLVKPIHGKSSDGITKFLYEDFNFERLHVDQIVQEYIGSSDNEITVGCFYHADEVYQCQLRRQLNNGHTVRIELIEDTKISDYCEKIIRSLKPKYPVNIQLRLRENGDPVCFEVNCRISGSAPFRHLLGFRDVEAMLLKMNGQDISNCFNSVSPIGTKGSRVLREEIYFQGNIWRL